MTPHEREAEHTDGCGEDESGPPWVLVTPGEVAGLVTAYREACREAGRVRESLAVQARAEQLPEVVAGVDVEGRPVVHVNGRRCWRHWTPWTCRAWP